MTTTDTARPRASGLLLVPSQATAGAIGVRRAEADDVPALHRLYSEPQIVGATGVSQLGSLAETRAWFDEMSAAGYLLVADADGAIAGSLGLRLHTSQVQRHTGEICRVGVGAAWQGRGVGSRLMAAALELADDWLDLLRVELMVRADNPAAIALYRKHGFAQEGLLRGYGYRHGTFVDIAVMARLRGPLAERQ